ncbi:hypothetical protein PVK06_011554 [Gossypium arboreum]|uniref:Uncharacterized protein n=1 Tax=Gossypium arboreum TaxID=29729 RepID=A0ABR0Q997_GOSAR|nr:hypothetical protein PVK06_011554 [Gossypium arboreum]
MQYGGIGRYRLVRNVVLGGGGVPNLAQQALLREFQLMLRSELESFNECLECVKERNQRERTPQGYSNPNAISKYGQGTSKEDSLSRVKEQMVPAKTNKPSGESSKNKIEAVPNQSRTSSALSSKGGDTLLVNVSINKLWCFKKMVKLNPRRIRRKSPKYPPTKKKT